MANSAQSEMRRIRREAERTLLDQRLPSEARLRSLARAERKVQAIAAGVASETEKFEALKQRAERKQVAKLAESRVSGSRRRMAESLRRARQVSLRAPRSLLY